MRAQLGIAFGWMTRGTIGILTILLVASWSPSAQACSCPYGGLPELEVLRAPLVFRGYVASVENLDQEREPRQLAAVDVTQTWKGDLPRQVTIQAGGPNGLCGASLRAGDAHVFLIYPRPNGELSTSICGLAAARGVEPILAGFSQALRAADADIQAAPGAFPPMLARARLLRRWRDHDRALAAYREIGALAPDLVEPQTGIARVLSAQGRAADALAVLEEARARLGTHPDILSAARIVRVSAGDLTDLANVDFRGAELVGIDLSRRDLAGTNFADAYLERVKFDGSDLREAQFEGTRLFGISMRSSDLRGARFVGTGGFPAVEGADLRGAHMERVIFYPGQSFRGSNMEGATIRESRLVEPLIGDTRFMGAHLAALHIIRAYIVNPQFEGATLRDVTFSGGEVYRTETGSQGAPLRPEDLQGAQLINVRID